MHDVHQVARTCVNAHCDSWQSRHQSQHYMLCTSRAFFLSSCHHALCLTLSAEFHVCPVCGGQSPFPCAPTWLCPFVPAAFAASPRDALQRGIAFVGQEVDVRVWSLCSRRTSRSCGLHGLCRVRDAEGLLGEDGTESIVWLFSCSCGQTADTYSCVCLWTPLKVFTYFYV